MTLADDVEHIRNQLGLAHGPLVHVVDAASQQLGVEKEIADMTLNEKVEVLVSKIGGGSSAVAVPMAIAYPIDMAVAAPVAMMITRTDTPQGELQQWLATYPNSGGGPRGDQLKAYGWFDSQGWAGSWPVHRAALRGEADTIRQLCLMGGRNANEQMMPWYNSEPLGWAASLGHLNAVIALIECGADPQRPPNLAGFTPLMDALRENHMHIAKFLIQYKWRKEGRTPRTAETLFDKTAHSNGGPRPDQSLPCITLCCAAPLILCPTHCLSLWGCADAVDALTSCTPCNQVPCTPCDPNSMNPLWCCAQPVGWASSMGQLHTVMALVKNGADPEAFNLAQQNAFTDAGREKHMHVVEWLLEWNMAGKPRGGTRWRPLERVA